MSWFSDLLDTAVQDAGQLTDPNSPQAQQLQAAITQAHTVDHIPVQNETVARFSAVLQQYDQKQISAQDAVTQVQKFDRAFTLYAQSIGSRRALQGANDVHALANRIVTGFGAAPTATATSPGTTVPLTPSTLLSNPLLLAGLGFVLLRKN